MDAGPFLIYGGSWGIRTLGRLIKDGNQQTMTTRIEKITAHQYKNGQL